MPSTPSYPQLSVDLVEREDWFQKLTKKLHIDWTSIGSEFDRLQHLAEALGVELLISRKPKGLWTIRDGDGQLLGEHETATTAFVMAAAILGIEG